MGPCVSVTSTSKSSPKNSQSASNVLNPNSFPQKSNNSHSIIENNKDRTITKTIKQINGDAIRLQNNTNCIIIILDHSGQIEIQDCHSCYCFLAPCRGSIIIRNCTNMNIVSASSQVRIANVTKSNFFLFTPSLIAIESSRDIGLGSFFIEYMELPEMFQRAKLNIWENTWSEYHLFTKDSEVTYASDEAKQSLIDSITPGFRDIYVNMNQFQFVPFTYGKSFFSTATHSSNFASLCIVFTEENCNDTDLLRLITPEELNNRSTKLIQTIIIKEKSEEYVDFKSRIDRSNNDYLIEYFSQSKNAKTIKTKKSNVVIQKQKTDVLDVTLGSINYKWVNKGELLFLWLVNDSDNFEEMKEYAESNLDSNCAWILKDDLNVNEKDYQMYLKKLFKLI